MDRARQTRRETLIEVFNRWIEIRIGTPAKLARAIEHLLDAHLENDVGMGAHPDTTRSDFLQQRVEPRSVLARDERVDPDEHAVGGEETHADLFFRLLGINDQFGHETDVVEGRDNKMVSRLIERRQLGFRIAAPNERNPTNRLPFQNVEWRSVRPLVHAWLQIPGQGEGSAFWASNRLTGRPCNPIPVTLPSAARQCKAALSTLLDRVRREPLMSDE